MRGHKLGESKSGLVLFLLQLCKLDFVLAFGCALELLVFTSLITCDVRIFAFLIRTYA